MDENKPNDDDYGLPDESYEPINRDQPEEMPLVERRFEYDEEKSNTTRVVVVIVALLLVAGAIFSYFYFFDNGDQEELRANQFQETPVEPEEENLAQDFSGDQVPENVGSSDWETAEETVPAEPEKPEKGTIGSVNERTGRSYIIIGSFIDDDLARDHGNKLAAEGVSTKVIAPYGNTKYYRLSVADYPTVSEAVSHLEAMKTTYGNDIWVLKY